MDTFKITNLTLKQLIEYRFVVIIDKRDSKKGIVSRRPFPSAECLQLILSEVHPTWSLICETEETSESKESKIMVKTVCKLIDENDRIIRQHTSCDKREELRYGKEFFDDKAYQVQESKTAGYVLRSMGMHRYIMKQLLHFYDHPEYYIQLFQQLPGNNYGPNLVVRRPDAAKAAKKEEKKVQNKTEEPKKSAIKIPNMEEDGWTYEKVGLAKTGGLQGMCWQHLIEDYPLAVQNDPSRTKRGAEYLHQLSKWEESPELMKVARKCLEIRKEFKKEIMNAQKGKEFDEEKIKLWLDTKTGISVCGDMTFRDLALNKELPRGEPGKGFLKNGVHGNTEGWDEFCALLHDLDLEKFPQQQDLFAGSGNTTEGSGNHYVDE